MPKDGGFSGSEAGWARARAQLLVGPRRTSDPVDVTRRVVGLNAQRRGIAALSVRARSRELVEGDYDRARIEDRSLVRAWFMRLTLHTVTAEDAGWLLGLLGPVFATADARRRAQLGLTDDLADRGVRVLARELESRGPLTRAGLGEALQRAGLAIDVSGQALVHLISLASLRGLVCSGPWLSGKETHVLLPDWADVGPAREPERALPELARRYLAAFAPATPLDFAKWSGLAIGTAREAWRLLGRELVETRVEGEPAWVLARGADALAGEGHDQEPSVRLLPAFDDYLFGWRSRELVLERRYERLLTPGGGAFRPVVVANGRGVATWRLQGDAVEIQPFAALDKGLQPGIDAEVADLGRFLGKELRRA